MSTEPHVADDAERRSREVEYKALRDEILKRIEMRQQIISVTLTLAGIFLGVGLTRETVPLIYPPLAAFLALSWSQNDFRIRATAKYIREELEVPVSGLGYETYVQRVRESKKEGLGAWRFIVLAHGGIFLITQLMAIGIELLRLPFYFLQWSLLAVDVLSVGLVIWLMKRKVRVNY